MNFQDAFDTPLKEGQSVLAILNHTGDTKIIWDRSNEMETGIARAAFDKAKREGYVGYKVTGKDGMKGEVMAAFDPEAERVILAPPLKGGR